MKLIFAVLIGFYIGFYACCAIDDPALRKAWARVDELEAGINANHKD